MLTGQRAFQRDTPADTMTAILKEDPPELPIAAAFRRSGAHRRALPRKGPGQRASSPRDLAFALEALASHSGSDADADGRCSRGASWARTQGDPLEWALSPLRDMSVVAPGRAGNCFDVYFRRAPPAAEATRFVALPPDDWKLARQIKAWLVEGHSPSTRRPSGRLCGSAWDRRNTDLVRSFDTLAAKGLAGTERGVSPFWSPDSRSLGFFATAS